MGIQVKVPAVGESISEVTIANWLKKDGDFVKLDEVLAELESDKATFELTAQNEGVLKIVKAAGETVPIGEVICEIDPNGQAGAATPAQPAVEAAKPEKKESAPAQQPSGAPKATGDVKEMKVPAVGESITEVTISTWLKKDGDMVHLDEVIAEVESDKATFELPAEATGILRIVAKEQEALPIGGLICRIEVTESLPGIAAAQPSRPAAEVAGKESDKSYAAGHPSPAAAKIIEEKGMTPGQVQATGVGGRITKDDAQRAQAKEVRPSDGKEKAAVPAGPPVLSDRADRGERREKMSSLRRTIARRLVTVKNETAMLTTFNEVDMKPVMDMRSRYKDKFKEKYGVGLGFMSFFTKAVCAALKEFPAVNASLDKEEIIFHDYCDISIAVSTPRGLVVPVVRDADRLSFDQIEREIIRLATRGREGKLSIDEMTGGTFSITNGGVFGSMLSTPILNAPQSAILGMHNIVQRPVVKDGEVVVRPIMFVALSYDHRVIDGSESVSFLVRVKEMLEDPGRLILSI